MLNLANGIYHYPHLKIKEASKQVPPICGSKLDCVQKTTSIYFIQVQLLSADMFSIKSIGRTKIIIFDIYTYMEGRKERFLLFLESRRGVFPLLWKVPLVSGLLEFIPHAFASEKCKIYPK